MMTPERRPSMFDSAFVRGPRMHLDSLSKPPERYPNRKKYDNAILNGYFANHQPGYGDPNYDCQPYCGPRVGRVSLVNQM